MKKQLFVAFFSFFIVIYSFAQTSPATLQWERSQNGIASLQNYLIKSIQDASGNIYTLSIANGDIVLVKFNNSGGVVYSYVYNDEYNAVDVAKDFILDASGNAYIVGDYFTFNSPQWGPRTILFKVNNDGTKGWEYNYYSNDYQYYEPHTYNAITLDASNNIYVTGSHVDSIAVCKFNNSGVLQYKTYVSVGTEQRGVGNDIAVDGTGNAYITGFVGTYSAERDAMVAKVSSTGVTQWTKRIAGLGLGDDFGSQISVDQSSNVYVLSSIADTSDTHFSTYLTKYNASGGQQFVKHLYTTGQINSTAVELLVDNLGNSYSAVQAQYTSTTGISTIYKYSSSGTLNYNIALDHPSFSNDVVNDIFLDGVNNVYATGQIDNPLSGNHFYSKISAAGSLVFSNQLVGSSIDGQKSNICADASGFMNVIGTTNRIYNVRLNNTGVFQFEGTYSGSMNTVDNAIKVIAQGSGSVYALGNLNNELSNSDVVVVKYDAGGNVQWQNLLDDFGGFDYAHDMGKDSIYNIYVLGEKAYGVNVSKIDSIGSILWTTHSDKRYRKCITQNDGTTFLAASGEAYNTNYKIFQVGKINSAGTFSFESTATQETDYVLTVGSMNVDNNNDVIVAGERRYKQNQTGARIAIVVDKFSNSGSGSLTWHREIPIQDSTTNEAIADSYISKVLVDANNNVFVFGTQDTVFPGTTKVFLSKISSAGVIQWTQYFYSTYNSHVYSTDARFLSNGQVILFCGTHNGGEVKKINPNTGALIWNTVITGTSQAFGGSMRIDNNDDVFVGGRNDGNVYLAKVGSAGNLKWVQHHQGAYISNDYMNHLDVTNNGRIYAAAAMVNNTGDNTDFSVLKFCDIAEPTITTFGNTQNICPGSMVTFSATGGNTFLWNNSSVNDSITVGTTGDYYCSVYKSDGCYKNTDTINVQIKTPPSTPQICAVTVDSLSTHNIIFWDKTSVTGASAFNIYREDVTNVYSYIGTVVYDSLSEFHDYGANPNVTTKRYKITAIDTCGQESPMSNYHNTIYIVSNGSGQFSWNPIYTIENTANPVNNYLLMRDDNSTGNWTQINSTAGTQFIINDINYGLYPNGRWRVETAWNISCLATRGAINTSRSNIKSPTGLIGLNEISNSADFTFSPNPANDQVVIKLPRNSKVTTIEIYNTLGQKVFDKTINEVELTIDITLLQAGTYFVKARNENGTSTKKLIKN